MRTETVLMQQWHTNMTTFWLQNCRFTCFCAFISCKITEQANSKKQQGIWQTLYIRHIIWQQSDRHHQLEAFLFRWAWRTYLVWIRELSPPFLSQIPRKKPEGEKKNPQNQTTQNPTKQKKQPNENKHHPSP